MKITHLFITLLIAFSSANSHGATWSKAFGSSAVTSEDVTNMGFPGLPFAFRCEYGANRYLVKFYAYNGTNVLYRAQNAEVGVNIKPDGMVVNAGYCGNVKDMHYLDVIAAGLAW